MNKNTIWILGFVVLFLINVMVELILLPLWGLDNTEKNDIYFKSWWVVVGFWLLFGRKLLTLSKVLLPSLNNFSSVGLIIQLACKLMKRG